MTKKFQLETTKLYFDEPRLKMNSASRFIYRFVVYCVYTLLIAIAASFLLSSISWLFWLGVGLTLFLLDRLIHLGQSEYSLINLMTRGKAPGKINIASYLSPHGLIILEKASEKALILGGDFYLELIKLLVALPAIQKSLYRMDVSPQDLEQKIDGLINEILNTKSVSKDSYEALMDKIAILAVESFKVAAREQGRSIEPNDIFATLGFINHPPLIRLFHIFSIEAEDMENVLIFSRFYRRFKLLKRLPASLGGFAHRPFRLRHRIMNRAWTSRPTPTLDQYATDFTDLARGEKIGFLIGHQQEYDHLVDTLCRKDKYNALLVGEPGSGKETMVAHLAFEIIKDRVPAPLFDKRLISLQIGQLIAGASPDEVSGRINKIVEEIVAAANVILYIPEIHNLSKTSGEGYLSAADILIPAITGGAFPVIGASFSKEFKQVIEAQSDFVSAFEIIRVEEISENDAARLLTYYSIILESQYKIIISFGAIKEAVNLASKYFHNTLLPASAENLLKEALADASQKKNRVLKSDDVIAIAERKINIPIHRAGEEEAKRLLNLEKIIHERLINQEEAVKAVSRALREYRSGLSRKGGPIAVFLFVGPTGVGKTELSKILAKIQFGSEDLMVRFDMSEYQDKQSIFRFIGSPDGKMVGSLTESIIQKPYSLILLDEFEKAHADILNLFLQVFDDGRLTDSIGRTVDFQNTIIIATSNAHSEFIKSQIEAGEKMEKISEELKKKLTDYFRPELLNRFSSVIVFKNLSPENIKAITRFQLADLAKALEESHGITLTFDESIINKIAELGYDPVFGARPLRGVISEKIRSVLAEKILKGEVSRGGTIKAVLENDEITLK